jgi:hypothetical protein
VEAPPKSGASFFFNPTIINNTKSIPATPKKTQGKTKKIQGKPPEI